MFQDCVKHLLHFPPPKLRDEVRCQNSFYSYNFEKGHQNMVVPYYRKLTLVLIEVFEIWRKNYFPMKEINAKEVVKFQNEGN